MIGTTICHSKKIITKPSIFSSSTFSPLSSTFFQLSPTATALNQNLTLLQQRNVTLKPTTPQATPTTPLYNLPPVITEQIKIDLASVDLDHNGKIDADELPPQTELDNHKDDAMEQAIAKARKLPIEVVDLRSVKIGGEVYELDRAIKIPSSSATDGETEAQSWPAKKAKTEEREYYLEIKWENPHSFYDAEYKNWVTKKYSMFSDEIPDEDHGGFEMSRAFQGAEINQEEHRCDFTLCLVDGKSENRNTMVEIEVFYWTFPINLTHFHFLPQDLANFCRDLWNAVGRDDNDYCDVAIKFGEPLYFHFKIHELIEATGIFRNHVMYIKRAKLMQGASSRDSMRLLQMIYHTFPTSVLSYERHLKDMGIMKDQCAAFGFQHLSYCFVGPTDEI